MSGHTIDKCFKLQGYPNPNKNKKIASSVSRDTGFGVQETSVLENRFKKLVMLIGKQRQDFSDPLVSHHAELASSLNLAGNSLLNSKL